MSTEHLVFRNGMWNTISLPFSDPVIPAYELKRAAAQVATMSRYTVDSAIAASESAMYQRLYPGLGGVPRKEHHAPEYKKKESTVYKKPNGGRAA